MGFFAHTENIFEEAKCEKRMYLHSTQPNYTSKTDIQREISVFWSFLAFSVVLLT